MNDRLIDINLVRDNVTLVAINTAMSAMGETMMCHRCGDVEAPIEGLLVIEQDEEAWPLCGACMRGLPLVGAIV